MEALEASKASIEQKKKEIKELEQAVSAIYTERQKTCSHPNRKSTPYEHWCDDCGWAKDRSF